MRGASASLACCALVGVSAACSGQSAAATIPPNETTHVRVAALSTADDVPLYIAQQRGLFAAQGLQVTIDTVAQSNLAIPELNQQKVDIQAGGNYGTYFQAADSHQVDLRIVAEGGLSAPGQTAVVVPPGSPIDTPGKLANATIAINNPAPNIQSVTLDRVLRSMNIDPGNVHYVGMPFSAALSALRDHTIDAAWFPEPFVTQAEQQGAKPILSPCSGPTADFPLDGYYSTADFARRNPHTVAAFRRAIQQASGLAADHQLVVDTLSRYAGIDPSIASLITLPGYPTTLQPRRLQRLLDLMYDSGAIHSALQATSLIAETPTT
ncbi:sulfonate ABC transporter substrate-binding protein [Amycolatopsis acidiphila]|nr:sulfonate ABC transporter substrate-binding protein [Amycolatopsis acidiphila]